MPEGQEFLAVLQVSRELDVSPDTVRRWIRNRRISAFNTSGNPDNPRWRIQRQDLDEFKQRHKNQELAQA